MQLPMIKKPWSWDDIWASCHAITHMVLSSLGGALLRMNASVSNAWPQNDIDKSERDIMDLTQSSRVRLRRSDTPLCCSIPDGVHCGTIQHALRCASNSKLRYSPLTAPSWCGSLFFFNPRQRRRKQSWCLTGPVGKPQEEGMMSTTVSFPSVWNQDLIHQ
jgi:hypothetical protein